jgi:hypothetical protein
MTKHQDPFAAFSDVVNNLNEIRQHMGEPVRPVVEKVLDHLDDVSRKIIEKSPFIVVASASGNGYPDISPKGEIST